MYVVVLTSDVAYVESLRCCNHSLVTVDCGTTVLITFLLLSIRINHYKRVGKLITHYVANFVLQLTCCYFYNTDIGQIWYQS